MGENMQKFLGQVKRFTPDVRLSLLLQKVIAYRLHTFASVQAEDAAMDLELQI